MTTVPLIGQGPRGRQAVEQPAERHQRRHGGEERQREPERARHEVADVLLDALLRVVDLAVELLEQEAVHAHPALDEVRREPAAPAELHGLAHEDAIRRGEHEGERGPEEELTAARKLADLAMLEAVDDAPLGVGDQQAAPDRPDLEGDGDQQQENAAPCVGDAQ